MTHETTERTSKERLERYWVLVKRSRTYARSTAILAGILVLLALGLALTTKRVYRSETTVVYRDAVRTGREMENATQRTARLGPRLKEYVFLRSRLQSTIERFDLYPDLVRRSMLDALEEIQKNISFRTRSPDTFALAFLHENPEMAQVVTAHLAATMIADYTSENLDSALTTHDVLQTEVDSAQNHVEETSRALARFLALHPQFTWGLGDSPYASGQQATALPGPARSKDKPILDNVLAQLIEQLRTIDAELAGSEPTPASISPFAEEAQKQRNAAATALAAAEADLEQKLRKVTKAHPDAMIAQAHVDRARAALATAETNLTRALVGTAPTPTANNTLDVARHAELQTQRQTIAAQIAARRAGKKLEDPRTALSSTNRPEAPDVVELETEWHRLRLDLERARDAFRKAEDKERTARLQATSAEREVQESLVISDPAYLPVHPESGRGRVFLAGSFVAILIALGYAGARVLLCDTLFDEGDVLALGSPPLLVTIPHICSQGATIVARRDYSPSDTKAKRNDNPLVRRDEPSRAASQTLRSEVAQLRQDEPRKKNSRATLAQAIHLPAQALHAYVELRAPNLVVLGAPFESSTAAIDELVRESPTAVLRSLRVLRHRLEQRRGNASLVVCIQSAAQGEGKTTLATHLALALSEAERARVVLVEGNVLRPKLATILGFQLPDDLGLTMQIRRRMQGNASAWSILRLSPALHAVVEAAESSVFPGALHSSWFPVLIRELSAAYDYVVIDGCAVLDAGDANVLEEVSDAVVLLARAGATTGSMVTNAVRQLGDRRVFGLVLNDEPAREQ
ncbi:MAG TPA: hypothetical protein PK156_30795 [Polyangium sp.]|nr:hypothetical protein [Polyangium sp.]